jgi:hypothetical protein
VRPRPGLLSRHILGSLFLRLGAAAIVVSAGLTLLPSAAVAAGPSCIGLGAAANYGEYGDGSNFVDGDTVGAGGAYNASTSLDNVTFGIRH